MLNWLRSLIKVPEPPEQYVLTTEGNVGKVEKINDETHTVVISFGSFNGEGWNPNKEVVISKGNVEKYITKEECASRLSERYASKNKYKSHF